MGIVAIASYRPKAGKADAFLGLLKTHVPTLRRQGLVSDRASYAMRSANGTIVEVFEWLSEDAKTQAHQNRDVMNCWNQFFELADIVPLDSLEESKAPFAGFELIEL